MISNYRREEDFYKNLSFCTKLTNSNIVTSIFRKSSVMGDETFCWETILWKRGHNGQRETILDNFSDYSLENTIRRHEDLFYTTQEEQT